MAAEDAPWIMNPFPPPNISEADVTDIVTRLCQSLNYPVRIRIYEGKTGGNNSVILFNSFSITAEDESTPCFCVLRTAKRIWRDPNRIDSRIQKMAAFYYRHGNTSPFIPSLMTFDATSNNVLRCPYIILSAVNGRDLRVLYTVLDNQDAVQVRIGVAYEVALFIKYVESFEFNLYGTFEIGAAMSAASLNPNAVRDQMSLYVSPWTRDSSKTNSKICHFLMDLLASKVNQNRNQQEEERFRALVNIAKSLNEMEEKGPLTLRAEPAVLWHPDFHPRNIMMTRMGNADQFQLTGVIDWDGAKVLPRIMTRRPPDFLWREGNLTFEQREMIKRSFYMRMEELLPGYRQDAHGNLAMILRGVGFYALTGGNWDPWPEISFHGLIEEWNNYRRNGLEMLNRA